MRRISCTGRTSGAHQFVPVRSSGKNSRRKASRISAATAKMKIWATASTSPGKRILKTTRIRVTVVCIGHASTIHHVLMSALLFMLTQTVFSAEILLSVHSRLNQRWNSKILQKRMTASRNQQQSSRSLTYCAHRTWNMSTGKSLKGQVSAVVPDRLRRMMQVSMPT